jgi:hypothetical protein
MTNPKPTEGWAIVAKDGRAYRVYLDEGIAHSQSEPDDGDTIIPVTIIPTSDLVREAARVLADAIDTPHDDEDYAASEMAVHIRLQDRPVFRAALRTLAGQGGE